MNKKIDNWLKSDKHRFDCASYSEGQACCMDKDQKGRKLIQALLNDQLDTAMSKIDDAVVNKVVDEYSGNKITIMLMNMKEDKK